jgi:hypothetical protein
MSGIYTAEDGRPVATFITVPALPFMAADGAQYNGFGGIRVHFDIRADASPDDIKSLVAQSQKRSAVFDIVTNPTNVFVTVN